MTEQRERQRGQHAIPRGISLEPGHPLLAESHEDRPLVITRRWFRPRSVLYLVGVVGWNGVLVAGFVDSGSFQWSALLLIALGAGMGYVALGALVNKTTVRIEGRVLTVRHGPIPWLADVSVARSALRRLYLHRNDHFRWARGIHHTWDLRAETDAGDSIKLLSRLDDPAQATYIRRAIETHLGLTR